MTASNERVGGVGLALSGGGFRATLFHLGSLWRLNELGWLPKLSEITSVSGGSIIAGHLGLRWKNLVFNSEGISTNYQNEIVAPIRAFCAKTIDVGAIIGGILSPFKHPSDLVISRYKKHLYGDATLQALPGPDRGPRFTIYATSLQTGASFRFAKPYMADYHIGLVGSPGIGLAQAVAASSAFPPVLCPVVIKVEPGAWKKSEGADLYDNEKLRSKIYLGDGGIYDNLGLERIWDKYETVLTSDAGAPFSVDDGPTMIRFSQIARTMRTLSILNEQCRALRKRMLIGNLKKGEMKGTYWGISTDIEDYELQKNGYPPPMVSDTAVTRSLSQIRTRLNAFSDEEQGRLINWGYALTDSAMRRHLLAKEVQPGRWPVPEYAL
jgi:NTE family protein